MIMWAWWNLEVGSGAQWKGCRKCRLEFSPDKIHYFRHAASNRKSIPSSKLWILWLCERHQVPSWLSQKVNHNITTFPNSIYTRGNDFQRKRVFVRTRLVTVFELVELNRQWGGGTCIVQGKRGRGHNLWLTVYNLHACPLVSNPSNESPNE